ncbi:hypothetical protein [Actinobacillus suis]|uniref:Uroporphyrinogen decarboxylase n=2 Tax=Actinobacillus suis TaxID=716 RepID=K0FWH9_ACTSU|nr:hypothetical protein [Actinobacillus suis]AFU18752.1 hypothetical protein ASU2_03060 [Actinobacillus suis H91-0380]AIJ30830.1 hypothetical protein ASU1_02780 [Actinobacillus suis ATCC 33415]MCO4167023.1 hypothetical protein [Actinobacillus suis]MCO4168392.1 hypothetical protein [Actinobacillus suis]MCQ9629035.1 hypothetical protein [Actinobacillus suis]
MSIVEFLSYGSVLILILSFFIRDMITLRLSNIVWGLGFVLYGFTTKAYIVAILNMIIVGLNGYLFARERQ